MINWKLFTPVVAIGAIVFLETLAMAHGYNGTILKTAIAAIAGIGGFTLAKMFARGEKVKD